MNLPNKITVARIVLAVSILVLLLVPWYELGIEFPTYVIQGKIIVDLKYIIAGVLKPNDALPSVRNVAKDLGINPNTVSKAYTELDMMNIIYSIAGKGMFVSDNTTYNEMYLKKIKKEFSESSFRFSLF